MFSEKTKKRKWQSTAAATLLTLMAVLSGCGNSIKDNELNSDKIGNKDVFEEDRSEQTSSDKGNTDTESKYESQSVSEDTSDTPDNITDETTTEKGEDTTKEQDTETESHTTTQSPPATTPTTTQKPTQPPTTQPKPTQPPTTQPTTTKALPPAEIKISNPVASGAAVDSENGYIVDSSNASAGYIMVKGPGSGAGICFQAFKDSTDNENRVAQYVATDNGSYAVIPLTSGSGKYIIRAMEQKSGSKYTVKCTAEINVSIANETLPYIYPNYTVNFSAGSVAVSEASRACAGCATDQEKVAAVRKYIIDTLSYDYDKADLVKNGSLKNYIPNVDSILASGKGICYDYSALFAAMLRCQGIPVKLVKGFVPEGYHAWNEAYYGGAWHRIDCTYEDIGGSQAASYQDESYY